MSLHQRVQKHCEGKKVKLSLRHEGVCGSGCIDHIFLTSALVGCEWSPPRPGKAPGTLWIGGWVDPRAGLDNEEKRKFLNLPGLEIRPLRRPTRS
jgi:hypothetical protein